MRMMDKIVSMISLLSVIWSNVLIFTIGSLTYVEGRSIFVMAMTGYAIVFLYDVFTVYFCKKRMKEKQTSGRFYILALIGATAHATIALFALFAIWVVAVRGGV